MLLSRRHLHICHSLELGGITTLVNSLVNLNNNCGVTHHTLVWKKNINDRAEYDISGQQNKYRAFNSIIENYDLIFVHSLKLFMVLGLLKRKRNIFLFQHGITFGNRKLTKYFKRLFYFSVINILGFAVICSSSFAKKKLLGNIPVFNKKLIHIIPFGIDLKRKKTISVTNEKLKVGFAGRLVNQKRIHKVYEAFSFLNYNPDIEFRVAGIGPLMGALKKKSLNFNSKNIITIFEEHVENIPAFFSSIDILILPSKGESFGLVVLEALSQNIPVILFKDTGACVDFITDKINGFVINNSKELSELLGKLQSVSARKKLKESIQSMDLSKYDIRTTKQILDAL